ncbi:DUF982 domain-containing protein [Pararhizobium arenae]|uniref:DUF982 domain-containing protein n=1 Tax=Pararhizobium arenae TaxID=1856850 RepID=UPI00094AEE76|nr:DUF982 domain-containing protein [Pararhizobium arenae]
MTIRDRPWTKSLHVRPYEGLERSFCSIYDALDYLENEWPFREGKYHLRAITACRGVLNGLIKAEVAREAFIAACLEASMNVALDTAREADNSETELTQNRRINLRYP